MAPRVLLATIILLTLHITSRAQDASKKSKVPHEEGETSLVRIKAAPEKLIGNRVIICGGVEISDYFNFSYDRAQRTHYSLRFFEAGEMLGDQTGEKAHLYLPKSIAGDSIEVITKASEQKKIKLMRAEVTLIQHKYLRDKQWDMLEVVDLQFLDPFTGKWGPWEVKSAKEAEEKRILAQQEDERAAQEAKDKEKKAKIAAVPKKSKEELAATQLKLAKSLLEKNETAARKRLQELVDQYPDTPAAADAKKLLGRD